MDISEKIIYEKESEPISPKPLDLLSENKLVKVQQQAPKVDAIDPAEILF